MACGFAYTAAVTRDGSVYTWGAGENGRLGLGDEQDKTTPGHVEELGGPRRAVKEIFAGSVHTCALLENGQVFSWGKCEYTGHGLSQVRRSGWLLVVVVVGRLVGRLGDLQSQAAHMIHTPTHNAKRTGRVVAAAFGRVRGAAHRAGLRGARRVPHHRALRQRRRE